MPRKPTGNPRGRPPGISTPIGTRAARQARAEAERRYREAEAEARRALEAAWDKYCLALAEAEKERREACTPPLNQVKEKP